MSYKTYTDSTLKSMTIKEFFEWALTHNLEDYEMRTVDWNSEEFSGLKPITTDVANGLYRDDDKKYIQMC